MVYFHKDTITYAHVYPFLALQEVRTVDTCKVLRLEVVVAQMVVLRVITPCRVTTLMRPLAGTCCLHLQGN